VTRFVRIRRKIKTLIYAHFRALNLSNSLDKLKTEILGLKHSVAESLILPAKHSIEDLQVTILLHETAMSDVFEIALWDVAM
jgi:hypothetical protein